MDALDSPIVDVVTVPSHTQFPVAAAYFLFETGQKLLIDMTTPLEGMRNGRPG